MATAYIGLGSNLGNCRDNLLQAWTTLGAVKNVRLLSLSSPYRSEPVGMESQNWFINAVGSLETSLQPGELLTAMLTVEKKFGRTRVPGSRKRDRSLDLDLLYWDDRVSTDPALILPHPEIANRLFVLLPLAEIGPDLRHPVTGKTSRAMLHELLAKGQERGAGPQIEKSSWSGGNNEVVA